MVRAGSGSDRGRRRTTIADVAQRAGVSPTAVSLVLNERPGARISAAAVERIRAAADELDYRPNPAAQSLRMGRTRTVGFISDEVTVTRFASAMIRGAMDAADALDHTLLIAEAGLNPDRVARAAQTMVDRNADGLVFALMGSRRITLPPLPSDVPVVIVNGHDGVGTPSVRRDEFGAGKQVANALLDAGHRRIALIANDPVASIDETVSDAVPERMAGITEALREHQASFEVVEHSEIWEPDVGYDLTMKVLDEAPDITAILALNDRLAVGIYQALLERGRRIPGDVSVASFDDDEMAGHLRPGLTTARIPYLEMGRLAMRMVLGEEPPHDVRVPMPLMVRGSIAPPSSRS